MWKTAFPMWQLETAPLAAHSRGLNRRREKLSHCLGVICKARKDRPAPATHLLLGRLEALDGDSIRCIELTNFKRVASGVFSVETVLSESLIAPAFMEEGRGRRNKKKRVAGAGLGVSPAHRAVALRHPEREAREGGRGAA